MSDHNETRGTMSDLDAIQARAAKAGQSWVHDPYGHLTTLVGYDVPALVAEVRRLRSFAMEVQGVRGVLAQDADPDPQGQWELGHAAACRTYLGELDNALTMLDGTRMADTLADTATPPE